MREVHLFGSYGALDVQSGVTVETLKIKPVEPRPDPSGTRDPVPVLCRKLVAEGLAERDEFIHVTRDGVSIWKNDLPVSWWADRDCVEGRNRSVKWVWHTPFDVDAFKGRMEASPASD